MKLKRPFYLSLLTIVAILIFTSGGLFKKAVDYKQENRKLILQNDSLQGVVISLNEYISDSVNVSLPAKKQRKKSAQN